MALQKRWPNRWDQLRERRERERKVEPKGPSRVELQERIKELEREVARLKRRRAA